MPLRTKLVVTCTLLFAISATVFAAHAGTHAWLPFWLLLIAVLVSSGLKVPMPSGEGSMSANFPFLLLGVLELSPLQAMVLAGVSVVAQCRWPLRNLLTVTQNAFNIANATISTGAAFATYVGLRNLHMASAPALACGSVVYFLWNTGAFALVIASSQGENPYKIWRTEFPWYLPFYIIGAALATLASWLNGRFGWATALLLVPAAYALFRAYTSQVAQLKERKQHLEETEALHMRTIEGLAMAIEAKDQNTHDHLFRVRNYVQAVGEFLGLDPLAMQALRTASFLHDIGKLAVPEHIINKPGKLTPEEFEKMKIHPSVGADILERVRFPYPVVPIVRSHHEWWNGTGYPDGLKGTEIPIGARVLTVVDCYDALVSDRPYRKGMTSQQAMAIIRSMSGKQFDPVIVEAFETCHAAAELETEALVASAFTPLNTEVEVWRGLAPGAGFETGSDENAPARSAFGTDERSGDPPTGVESLPLIAAATQEAQTLFEMSQSFGNSLSPNEIVSVMASRLHRLIPFDACAVYIKEGDTLTQRLIDGAFARHFTSAPIQLGEGISGWVAQRGKPLLNGNAIVEPGCPTASDGTAVLKAALSIPLFELRGQIFAVLTLYSTQSDSFLRDHLRMLAAMESKLSLVISNSLQFRRAETDGETDFLTGLPNARRLFLQLETELERCRETGTPLAVAICDLNAFKEINDRRGYLAGNRLLSLVADGFRQICGSCASVGRMGGDEFAFLLPGLEEMGARNRLEGVGEAIANATRRAAAGTKVTGSLGIAEFPADGTTAEELLTTAERRMYLEKQKYYSSNTALSVESSGKPALIACSE